MLSLSKKDILKDFKGPSYFDKGQCSEYQLVLLKRIYYIQEKNRRRKENKLKRCYTIKQYLGFIPYNVQKTNVNVYEFSKKLKIKEAYILNKDIFYPKYFLNECLKKEIFDIPLSYKIDLYNYKRCK